MKNGTQNDYLIYFISIFAAMTGLLFGYDTGVISGAILFIRHDFQLTSLATEITVSAVLLGALIGSAASGHLTDILGRRKILLLVALAFVIGTLTTAFAPYNFILIMGRIILGIAIGMGSFTAPLYLAEISPQKIRGMLVSLNQLAITIGILSAYIVDYYYSASGNWRLMLGLGTFPAIILLSGTFFLPESPRWLVLKGLIKEAHQTLIRIRATLNVHTELEEIKHNVKQKQATWRMLLTKKLRPIVYISLGLSFFQQATGINTIIYYAPTILQMTGFNQASSAILATLAIGVFNVLFTVIALPLIDLWGRRPLLLIGLAGMFISLSAQCIAFYFPEFHQLRWLAVGSMIFYIACFAMSLGPIMWLVISEVFPLEIRGIGISLAISASWAFNMLVALTLLTLIEAFGVSGTFSIYAGLCVLGVLFVYFLVPETRDCSLEEIEKNLREGKSARELGLPVKKKLLRLVPNTPIQSEIVS
ncbi:MAG: sugar porter family MFS transporter [Gammaproteobacteria bacterium]|nr:sugar porter family MFS transporter [Gammaproteobacteria bacterium]